MNNLNTLNAWSNAKAYHSFKSAQGYLGRQSTPGTDGNCGSSCGAGGDKVVQGNCSCGGSDQK